MIHPSQRPLARETDRNETQGESTTEDHPYWSVDEQEWNRADEFEPGERMLAADGATVRAAGMRWVTSHDGLAYNLNVEGIHTFHVGADEILVHNSQTCPTGEIIDNFGSLNDARAAARDSAGLGDDAVDFVQEIGPFKGRVTGRMSPDGRRGWRIDYDDEKGFHVNWWDRTGGRKRDSWRYGANQIDGGTQQDFWELLSHFPRN